ncbi:hypothetical protein [Sphingomonas sp. CROZ-RG-20F-R02-07]|uniref:hypothetical protein n=1 Tax=Sphingomonas sp. CROZ-RG-20F-R02-07 TaxID=2914832 RepID=UPI001F568405|nr:hypothetical protein [Sphingomonas sp. CROZ-RG-20F-R02-07]
MLLFALLLAGQAATSDIVVNGKRLDDAAAMCAKRQCTPLQDARVSIALAERAFRSGDYLTAKHILAVAVARERGNAASDPKPVAALYEAYATVAIQDGDENVYRRAVGSQVRTLRDNLPANDPAVLDAAFATGDMWMKLRDFRNAEQAYAAVEHRATAAGQNRIAILAAMRRIGLVGGDANGATANAMLAKLEARPGADDPTIRPAMRVLRLRIAARGGDDSQIDAIVRDIGHDQSTRPVLIWAPPYPETGEAAARDDERRFSFRDPASPQSSENSPYRWADVGFWIRPDGHTDEVTVLRGTPSRNWIKAYLPVVAARRYTGSATATGQGVYRVERFTERPTYVAPIGSLIQRRAGPVRLEVLDLTGASAPMPVRS